MILQYNMSCCYIFQLNTFYFNEFIFNENNFKIISYTDTVWSQCDEKLHKNYTLLCEIFGLLSLLKSNQYFDRI